jgi:hypothetical protein
MYGVWKLGGGIREEIEIENNVVVQSLCGS